MSERTARRVILRERTVPRVILSERTAPRVILRERTAPRVILSERSERKDRFPPTAVAVETAKLPWLESDPFVASRLRMTR